MSFVIAAACWANLASFCHDKSLDNNILIASLRSPERKQNKSKNIRKNHYAFDVDHNGLDVNGFVLHADKHEGKRHKFRVYIDSNENNRFDKNDLFFGRTGLKDKHSKNGVGGILDEDEIGQLEVKFKKPKSNASMRDSEDIDGISQSIVAATGSIVSMNFMDAAGDIVAQVDPSIGDWWY